MAVGESSPTAGQAGDLSGAWIDRDISWLEFNRRVLHEALDERTPLLERVKFLAIFSANLDEFFMKRMSRLADPAGLLRAGSARARGADPRDGDVDAGRAGRAVTRRCCARGWPSTESDSSAGTTSTRPARRGLRRVRTRHLAGADAAQPGCRAPVPVRLEPLHIVGVPARGSGQRRGGAGAREAADRPAPVAAAEGRRLVRVGVRRPRPGDPGKRRAAVPGNGGGQRQPVPGLRDADVELDENDGLSKRAMVEEELRQRRFEPVVRLEVQPDADPAMVAELVDRFGLAPDAVYEMSALLDYTTLFEIAGLDVDELRDPPWTPLAPRVLEAAPDSDIFSAIRSADILLHHPYESFYASVERFIREAADDTADAVHQDDRLPGGRRHPVRALADRGGRGRQAGGLRDRAERPLRRGAQPALVAGAGAGRSPRHVRGDRPQDPQQGRARCPK